MFHRHDFPRSQIARSNCRRPVSRSLGAGRGLHLEALEDRRLLSVDFTVSNVFDSGAGSLRQTILDANAHANGSSVDRIVFTIPGSGLHTIPLLSPLPTITDPVVIDGYTQPGASVNSLTLGSNAVLAIQLNGASAGSAANGLTVSSGGTTVRGLVINRFTGHGILLQVADGNVVEGNYLGTDATGTVDLGNGGDGVRVTNASDGNRIGTDGNGVDDAAERNVIAGNAGSGVTVTKLFSYNFNTGQVILTAAPGGNAIRGNYVGVDATGMAALGNDGDGIYVENSSSTLIAGNLISANAANGVTLTGAETTGTVLEGNFIGTDASGLLDLGNASYGVLVTGASQRNRIGSNSDGVNDTAERNLISGNDAGGIEIKGFDRSDVDVVATGANTFPTALDSYVAAPSTATWTRVVNQHNATKGYTLVVYDLASQTWEPEPGAVTPTVWHHWLQFIVPDNVDLTKTTALLYIAGGSTGTAATDLGINSTQLDYALQTGSVWVVLRNVPNQALNFIGQVDDNGKVGDFTEDEIIALSFKKYLETGNANWVAYLPMVNSVIRAMDAVQAVDTSLPVYGRPTATVQIDNFVLSGGSKRGWTTQLATAVDPQHRVVSMIPLVSDLSNLGVLMEYQSEYYAGLTFAYEDDPTGTRYSIELHDYLYYDVIRKFGEPQGQPLLQIVDPFAYRDRANMTVPKYYIFGACDQFFVPGSTEFYIDALQSTGPTYLRYVPNAGHDLVPFTNLPANDSIVSMTNFYAAIAAGDTLPSYDWSIEDDGHAIRLTTPDTGSVANVLVWSATNPKERDFRNYNSLVPCPVWSSSAPQQLGAGEYVARFDTPATGATAFLIEITFNIGGKQVKFTSSVSTLAANDNNIIQGNAIGTDVTGTPALGNGGPGILLASANTTLVAGNLVADNAGHGVAVTGSDAWGNNLRGNAIYDNAGLGIDLAPRSNRSQAAPVLTAARPGTTTHLAASLHSTPSTTFTLNFYASPSTDAGHVQGTRFLASIVVATDANGDFSSELDLPAVTSRGQWLTATATDPAGNTSEFSAPLLIDSPPTADAGGPYLATEGTFVALDARDSFDADGDTLQYRWDFDRDGTWDTGWSTSPSVDHAWSDDGTGTITVEVSDGDLSATATASVTIQNSPPSAAAISAASDGFQGVAGQSRTFFLTANDLSPVDQAANFSFLVDWGDGQQETFHGPSGLSATHVYALPGNYLAAILSVTDKDAGTANPTGLPQNLNILAAEVQGTTLVLGGTPGNDTLVITDTSSAHTVDVALNGANLGLFAGATSVLCLGQGGTNRVIIQGTVGADTFTIDDKPITVNDVTVDGTNIASWQINGLAGNDLFAVLPAAILDPLSIDGGTQTDTVVGPDLANAWQITATGAGTLNTTLGFNDVENLTGGTAADTFSVKTTGAALTGVLNGGGGSDSLTGPANSSANSWSLLETATGTLNGMYFGSIENLTGGIYADTFYVQPAAAGFVSTSGGSGIDTLVGPNSTTIPNLWNLTAAAGTLNGLGFTSFENLTGGSGTDTFTFTDTANGFHAIQGSSGANTFDFSLLTSPVTLNLQTRTAPALTTFWLINSFVGSSGVDTLIGPNTAANWNFWGVDSGFVNGLNYSGFEHYVGGTASDIFGMRSPAATVTGGIDGGGGSDTLIGSNSSTPNAWNLTGNAIGTLNGMPFTRIENVTGGNYADTFRVQTAASGFSLIDGGAGTDTLTGPNLDNTWDLTGVKAGSLNGTAFANMENLSGGTDNDRFRFHDATNVFNAIQGGSGGQNTLDYSLVTTSILIDLQQRTASKLNTFWAINNLLGSTASAVHSITGPNATNAWSLSGPDSGTIGAYSFSGFGKLIGGTGTDTLTASNTNNAWTVTGAGTGTANGLIFTNMECLTGGTAVDTFSLKSATASLAGTLDGGGGTDLLIGFNNATTNQWNLTGAAAGTINGLAFSRIENLTGGIYADMFQVQATASGFGLLDGGNGTDTVRTANTNNVWTLTGTKTGTLEGLSFTSIENLTGGTGDDRFLFAELAGGFGTINGGTGGINTLDYSLASSAVAVDLQARTGSKLASFWYITSVVGSTSGSDSLQGTNASTTWTISGANSGTVGTVTFSAFENLGGGTGDDTLLISGLGSVSGTIDGGTGTNVLDYSFYGTPGVVVNLETGTATGVGVGASGMLSNFSVVVGTAGADSLTGGTASDVLVGAAGADMLTGSAGRDLLIGGSGEDLLHGGAGEDILVGGSVSYDNENSTALNLAAIKAIMAEWRRTDLESASDPTGYLARRDHLLTGSSGLNGSYLLDSSTVQQDAATLDRLWGDEDRDWFLASGEDQVLDQVTSGDQTETVTTI